MDKDSPHSDRTLVKQSFVAGRRCAPHPIPNGSAATCIQPNRCLIFGLFVTRTRVVSDAFYRTAAQDMQVHGGVGP